MGSAEVQLAHFLASLSSALLGAIRTGLAQDSCHWSPQLKRSLRPALIGRKDESGDSVLL